MSQCPSNGKLIHGDSRFELSWRRTCTREGGTEEMLCLELLVYPRAAVPPIALPADGTNLETESLFGTLALSRAALPSRVEAGARNPEHSAQERDRKLLPVRPNAGVLHRDSLARYTVAFLGSPAPASPAPPRAAGGGSPLSASSSCRCPEIRPRESARLDSRPAASTCAASRDESPAPGPLGERLLTLR